MEKIEIRYDKKKLIAGIALFTVLVVGSTYIAFFTKRFETNQPIKFVIVPLNLLILYLVFNQLKRVLENNPVITLTKTFLEINEDGKLITFMWTEIKDLRIEKKQSGNSKVDILSVKSDTKSGEVNISLLEKSVDDIRGLIRDYRSLQ